MSTRQNIVAILIAFSTIFPGILLAFNRPISKDNEIRGLLQKFTDQNLDKKFIDNSPPNTET